MGDIEVSGCISRVLNGHCSCHTEIKVLLEAVGGYHFHRLFFFHTRGEKAACESDQSGSSSDSQSELYNAKALDVGVCPLSEAGVVT